MKPNKNSEVKYDHPRNENSYGWMAHLVGVLGHVRKATDQLFHISVFLFLPLLFSLKSIKKNNSISSGED